MTAILYYPLVDRDTEGSEKFPLFPSENEADVRNSTALYLEEIVPKYYRLCKGVKSRSSRKRITVSCPVCGKAMKDIADGSGKTHMALYTCRKCNY